MFMPSRFQITLPKTDNDVSAARKLSQNGYSDLFYVKKTYVNTLVAIISVLYHFMQSVYPSVVGT